MGECNNREGADTCGKCRQTLQRATFVPTRGPYPSRNRQIMGSVCKLGGVKALDGTVGVDRSWPPHLEFWGLRRSV